MSKPTQPNEKSLTYEETRGLLSNKFKELADTEINNAYSNLQKDVGSEKLSYIHGNHKQYMLSAIEDAALEAVLGLEKNPKDKPNPKAIRDFKGKTAELSQLLEKHTKPFSGTMQDVEKQLQPLREEVTRFADNLKGPKRSSEKTRDMLVEAAAKAADTKIDKQQITTNANLKEQLTKVFRDIFDEQAKNHNLDQKTTEILKNNSDKLIDHILKKTQEKTEQIASVQTSSARNNLRKEIHDFNMDIKVSIDNSKSNWSKVADFCKAAKLDKLAEYCHDKHVEGLAKGISKDLGVKLANHKSEPNQASKQQKSQDHGR